MPALMIRVSEPALISVNGAMPQYVRESFSLPLGGHETVITAQGTAASLWCVLSGTKKVAGVGELSCWSNEIWELTFTFPSPAVSYPPLLECETAWGGDTVGLCGGWLVREKHDGTRDHFARFGWSSLTVLNADLLLLEQGSTAAVVNKKMEDVFPPTPLTEKVIGADRLTVTFVPGYMLHLLCRQTFFLSPFRLIRSELVPQRDVSGFDRLALFCEAVRLGDEGTVISLLTPSLKNEMSVEDIRTFLGPFDRVEVPRYRTADAHEVALRYATQEGIFRYTVFVFLLQNGLIDDIREANEGPPLPF